MYFKRVKIRLLRPWPIQLVSAVLWLRYVLSQQEVYNDSYRLAALDALAAFIVNLLIMTAISIGIGLLTAKKPPKPQHAQPTGLEQFSVPTAQEGRPIQVLFGKRYIAGPNIVWYGDLKSEPVIVRM